MKKLIATLLLMIGLTNLAIAEDCDADHQISSSTDISFVSQDHDSNSQKSNDCTNDCCTHQCHFGHCAFVLEENLFSFLPEAHLGPFFKDLNVRAIFPKNLFRPPMA